MLASAQIARLLMASEKDAGHNATFLQVKNRLDAVRRKLRPSDSTELLEFVMGRYRAGDVSYFRAEGRRIAQPDAPNTVFSSHPRQADYVAGVVMEQTANGFIVPEECGRSEFLRVVWVHAMDRGELTSMLDSCVLDLTHKVNRYGWYVAIVSARDATWTTRIVASAIVPRKMAIPFLLFYASLHRPWKCSSAVAPVLWRSYRIRGHHFQAHCATCGLLRHTCSVSGISQIQC